MNAPNRSILAAVALAGATVLLAGCWERPPIDSVQRGFRGTGMVEVVNPRINAAVFDANQAPPATAPQAPAGPPARTVYQNVQVLGDLDVASFNRLMVAMTSWVAPEQGCTYCHADGNFAVDGKYTKIVARRMLQLTQNVNAQWQPHVAQTGVTCYTCHRGKAVPENVWFIDPDGTGSDKYAGWRYGQNAPARTVGVSSLPKDPFTTYLLQKGEVRVGSTDPLPTDHKASIQQTEWTYALMMHFSDGLGVNCTYCHNSRAFGVWEQSSPPRATAWQGLRMVRALNNEYLEPLTPVFPAERLGPAGDVAKINCATCHNGVFKPLYGAPMLKDYPELAGPRAGPPTPAAAVVGEVLVVYFDVGSAQLRGIAPEVLAFVVEKLKADPKARAAVSGYHSASGDRASNAELAKQRAFSVAGTLQAAGFAPDRVVLARPQAVQANVAGEDPSARRVEVTVR
ncbi:MAG: photosynthetic reaction center cytochrome PufC [Betaproteobacteria bacterium]